MFLSKRKIICTVLEGRDVFWQVENLSALGDQKSRKVEDVSGQVEDVSGQVEDVSGQVEDVYRQVEDVFDR
jgi:hypothetical protein